MDTSYFLSRIADRVFDKLEFFSKRYNMTAKKCYLFSATLKKRGYCFWEFSGRIPIRKSSRIRLVEARKQAPGFEIVFSKSKVIFKPVVLKKEDKKYDTVKRKDTEEVIYRTLLYVHKKMGEFLTFYETKPGMLEEVKLESS